MNGKGNFLKLSVLIPGTILFVIAVLFANGKLVQRKTVLNSRAAEGSVEAASTPTIILADDFERNSVFNSDWKIYNSQMNIADFTLVSSADTNQILPVSGSKMLKISNNNEGLQSMVHTYSPALADGITKISFYDYGDNRSAGTIYSISNSYYNNNPTDPLGRYIIFQIDGNKQTYTYRLSTWQKDANGVFQRKENFYDVGNRTKGWHVFEIRVSSCGKAYGVIDGQPYSNYAIPDFGNIAVASIGRVWRGFPGFSYFDQFETTNYFIPASGLTNQQILDSWSDLVYEKYKITGADSNLLIVPIGEDRFRTSNSRFRFLADQAQMHLYYYYSRCESNPKKSNCDPADLTKAKNIIKAFIDNYEDSGGKPIIGQKWLSTITMNQNFFNTWWSWKDLDVDTKQKFTLTVAKEADFWTWSLNEIKTKPNVRTIPPEAGGGADNLSLLTAAIGTTEYLMNTRAEEIPPIAQFLVSAALTFPDNPNSTKWEEAAKCYAFHTFSNNEVYCGITAKNVADDYRVGNHGLIPNPGYALAGITALQQGQLSYLLAGKTTFSSEFERHIENGILSPVWQKNLTECGCSQSGCFQYNAYCHAGKDWGDTTFVLTSMMLGHWEQLGKTQQIRDSSVLLLRNLLETSYFEYKNLYWSKISNNINENLPLSDLPVHWMKNLELHAQESAKYWVTSNINNPDFRAKYFPLKLDICEENFLNRKAWSGEGNLIATCDANDKRVGNYSLKIDSSKGFSNVEFYTPLMKATPNTQYKLSYWVKTKDIIQADSTTQTLGKVYPALYKSTAKESDQVNSSNRISPGWDIGQNLKGTNDWAFKETVFNTTADTSYIRLRVQPGNAGKGIIWVDNVKLQQIGPAPSLSPTSTPKVTPTPIPTIIPTPIPTSYPLTTGNVCGYVKNFQGNPIPGYTVSIYNNESKQTVKVTTDANGRFSTVAGFAKKGDFYAVQAFSAPPAPYTGPSKTATAGWCWDYARSPQRDTPLNSTSYEAQRFGYNDCANSYTGGIVCRCNFKF